MVPAWKIKRELNRVKDQLLQLPRTLAALPGRLREPARRKAYLRDFDRVTKRHAGRLPAGERIAIFLLYQPDGISASTIATCNWLISEGYAPFLVLNCPVSDTDRDRLLDLCWSLLERPNFGYDFGGYQDAIRLLNRDGLCPERLIVMNDSVWMPMQPGLAERLEQGLAGADILGLLHDTKIIDGGRNGTSDKRIYSYIESYFYLLGRDTWKAPAFQKFWRDYKMSNEKANTIKHGEIGFSRAMAAAGLKLDGLCRRDLFLAQLQDKDDDFLAMMLKYAAYVDADVIRTSQRLAAQDPELPGWREAVLDHVTRTVRRRRFNASFPAAHDHIFGTAFMKKNREPIWTEMRRSYLRALEDGAVAEPPSVIRDEIEATIAPTRTKP